MRPDSPSAADVTVCNSYFGVTVLAWVRADGPPSILYEKTMTYGRVVAAMCGTLLFVGSLISVLSVEDLALQHPYSLGSAATSLAWMLFGFGASSRNRMYLLGIASNGLSAPALVPGSVAHPSDLGK